MLGWMGSRVLGQYDLLVGRRATHDDAVYLVGPNLAAPGAALRLRPDEFRTWVLLHELTHRAQFTGVPWMREHFTGLVDDQHRRVDPDPDALLGALRDALTRPDDGPPTGARDRRRRADRQARAARRDRPHRRADVAARRATAT